MPADNAGKRATIRLHVSPRQVIGPKRSELAELRTRAHREDVADDSPDACGRALERLDRARVIVALILNATAQPSPISTTPAFSSPAFTRMFAPVVGNFFSSRREFLYEQCSLHITEKMPSSVKFGSRPRIF
jgi:hypothetical protein